MSPLVTAARAALGTAGIGHVEGQLHLVVPLVNVGEGALPDVEVWAAALGPASRTSPAAFPIVLGTLAAGAEASVALRFSSSGLTVGARYLLTLTAHCTAGNLVYSMNLHRYVRIPPPSPVTAGLRARVVATLAPHAWHYALCNDEAADSGLYVSSLALMVSAPVAIVSTPPGWRGATDGISYVFWRAADYLPPYPNHLLPGQVLDGFALSSPRTGSQASRVAVSSWDHRRDVAGPSMADYVPTPYR
jgi:hypothetical protein